MTDYFGAIGARAGSRSTHRHAVRWFTARRKPPQSRAKRMDMRPSRSIHLRWEWIPAAEHYVGMARLATVFVSIALAYKVAELTWLVVANVQGEGGSERVIVSGDAAPYAKTTSTSPARDIASFHLFGKAQSSDAVAAVEAIATPTRLPLTLRGTLASADARLARALIANGLGEERSFAANDLVFGETTLETIQADHVVIRHGERRERLHFPLETSDTFADSASDSSAGIGPLEIESEFGPSILTPLRELRDGNSLREFRKYLTDHPHAFAALTEKPAETDPSGRVIGYRLDNVNMAAYLRQLGLRPGDVLTAVNNVPLSDARSLSPLIHAVASMEKIQIHYNRRGQPRVIALGEL